VFVRRKDAEREQARQLRAAGLPVRVIAARLGVAVSSVSVWVRDVEVPEVPSPSRPPVRAETPSEDTRRRCSRCGRDLPASEFNRAGDGRQYWCRSCFRSYFQARGDSHRAAVRAARERRRAAARALVLDLLAGECCVDCGEDETLVLEFDHCAGEKAAAISELVIAGAGRDRLARELVRCEIVCANCHRRRTAIRGRYYRYTREAPAYWTRGQRRNREHVLAILEATPCVDCGECDPLVLDFDHRGDKRAAVTTLANSCSLLSLEVEIAKCDVRCANCHTLRTRGSKTWRGAAF
jgi:hypothetical protein